MHGNENVFVFRSLGPLNFVHIWHDNTGKGTSASWFLKYIIVRDLQTMETFHFICQRWLAVEKEDGKVCFSSLHDSSIYCLLLNRLSEFYLLHMTQKNKNFPMSCQNEHTTRYPKIIFGFRYFLDQ